MEKKQVLIVDDAVDMRIFLSVLFKTGGYQAVAVKDGREGIQKVRQLRPDLIILDVMMPDQGGAAMYRALKTDPELSKIPVILLSAVEKAAFFYFLKMLRLHPEERIPEPEAYMEKPPDPDSLLDLAESLLNR